MKNYNLVLFFKLNFPYWNGGYTVFWIFKMNTYVAWNLRPFALFLVSPSSNCIPKSSQIPNCCDFLLVTVKNNKLQKTNIVDFQDQTSITELFSIFLQTKISNPVKFQHFQVVRFEFFTTSKDCILNFSLLRKYLKYVFIFWNCKLKRKKNTFLLMLFSHE